LFDGQGGKTASERIPVYEAGT